MKKVVLVWATITAVVAVVQEGKCKATTFDDSLDGICSIAVEINLSCERFVQKYLGSQPVIIRPSSSSLLANNAFVKASSRKNMMQVYGDLHVRMSTANSFTGKDWAETSLGEYLTTHVEGDDDVDDDGMIENRTTYVKRGNETYYLFGDQYGAAWETFLSGYYRPTNIYPSESFDARCASPHMLAEESPRRTTLSFGVAGRGTGVPFHFHGPGFLQQLHGRKRWFLYPPKSEPEFHPNESTLFWVTSVYPSMKVRPTHECVLEPRDTIYFPHEWMHATLNLSPYTAFMATFA
jgi:hypothetical protein